MLSLAAERLASGETGGVSTRSYSLISDKSMADCVEALIGAVLLHSGQTTALRWVARGHRCSSLTVRFMAGLGLNMSATASLEELLKGVRSREQVTPFTPQVDAFRNTYARTEVEEK